MLTIQPRMNITQSLPISNDSSPNYPSTTTTSPSNNGSVSGAESHDDGHNGIGESSSSASSSTSHLLSASLSTKCPECNETFVSPKVLDCFHTYCESCLDKRLTEDQTVECPECENDTAIGKTGIQGLPTDFAIVSVLEAREFDKTLVNCTGCKSIDTNAIAHCSDCSNFLCPNCVTAHRFMHCFEGHRVRLIDDSLEESLSNIHPICCDKHKNEPLRLFCRTCELPLCGLCEISHQPHDYNLLCEYAPNQLDEIRRLVGAAKVKANHIRSFKKGVEYSFNRSQMQYEKAKAEVNDTFDFYKAALEERHQELLKELETMHNNKVASLRKQMDHMQTVVDKLYMGCEFMDKQLKYANPLGTLLLKKPIKTRMHDLLSFQMENCIPPSTSDVEFVSNYQAIQVAVKNTFGYVRQASSENGPATTSRQPIARPNGNGNSYAVVSRNMEGLTHNDFGGSNSSLNSLNGFAFNGPSEVSQVSANSSTTYGAWSTALESTNPVASGHDVLNTVPGVGLPSNDQMAELTSRLISANIYPPKSQIKRAKMIYHCKFGEFGIVEGQFTEPSGVAVNAQNDIIVADTNNHRIQIFDREGRFKFQFGECGKRDGQLLYPNRVAVYKHTGDIIVTERSPTHQVQIFNQYGQFVRKFGANVLQHPRGVTVDNLGRIVIVECKVMRVIIFDMYGNILQKFSCSKHLEFPNGVVVNDREEIFISDNRAHCVKVFSYQGQFLRQIGGEGVSNYPIGVGINSHGEVLIADNHNNFNLTIFTQDGQIINALESKVKHAQCFDVALLDDNSIVLASKDYRLYIYRYLSTPHATYSFLGLNEPLTLDTFS